MRGLFFAAVLGACSSKAPKPEPQPASQLPIDAGTHQLSLGTPIANPIGHLDDDVGHRTTQPAASRTSRPIDVILRSTPTSAQAAVDGIVIGPTPAYWSGNADGREHEFTFVLSGHAIARYRFVPITSGTIHARLIPIAPDEVDTGKPPPELVPPAMKQPDAPPPPQPDAPLIVAPDAQPGSAFGPMP
jgi:hypothetical protein